MNNLSNLTRREFLAQTALASSAAVLGHCGATPALGAEAFSPPVAVFSKVYQELKLNFDQAAELTAEAGLDGIDCPVRSGGEIEPAKAADEMPRYAEALRCHKVQMLLLTTGIVGVSSPNVEVILRTAKNLGIKYYRLGFYNHQAKTPLPKQIAEVKAQLKDLAALNQELGVCALFQNHSPGGRTYFGGDLAELYELVKDFKPEQIGVAFDLGHAIIVHGNEWRPHFEKLKPHLKVAYIKDAAPGKRFVPFGEGEFAKTGYFTLLKQMGYRAPFSMHIEFDWAGKGSAKTRDALVKALQQSVKVLKRWVAQA